jgi:hypothetical protein
MKVSGTTTACATTGPMSKRRRSNRADERLELEALWAANCKQRGASLPPDWHAIEQHFAEQLTKVNTWNKKPSGKDVKEISGEDVMEILEIASMLTNHPAYEAARRALMLHRLDRGGLRRAFLKLRRRHAPPPEHAAADCVDWYRGEFSYGFRRAVEHVVANLGVPGTSFENAVEKTRKAYTRRAQHKAEQQRYLEQLHGLREPEDSR